MKRHYIFILICILFTVITNDLVQAQSPQKQWVLNTPQSGNKTYVAQNLVQLNPGFRYVPESKTSFRASINENLSFAPTDINTVEIPTQGTLHGSTAGSFSVSPMGAANYTIPIAVPGGLNNMAPQLSLSYDSNVGNSIAGWGWNISGMSAISRVPRSVYYDGEAKGVQNTNEDVLALDGKRLILVEGTDGADGAIYKFETEDFSSIKKIGDSFELTTQDGTIFRYAAKTMIGRTTTLTWYLNYVEDVYGNYISYEYKQEEGTYTYLQKIKYGSNANKETNEINTVEFTYEDRTDPVDIHYAKYPGRINKILKNITSKIVGNKFRSYDLVYEKDQVANRLVKVTENGYNNDSYNPTIIEWNTPEKRHLERTLPGFDYSQENGNALHTYVPYKNREHIAVDLNKDGLTDIVASYLEVDNIMKTSQRVMDYYEASKNSNGDIEFNLKRSVNSRGKMLDIISWYDGDILGQSIGSNYLSIEGDPFVFIIKPIDKRAVSFMFADWASQSIGEDITGNSYVEFKIPGSLPIIRIADINMDASTEIVCIETKGQNNIYRGHIFFLGKDESSFAKIKHIETKEFNITLTSPPKSVELQDFDGDGMPDLYVLTEKGHALYYNQGESQNFFSDEKTIAGDFRSGFNSSFYIKEIGDFNGDGLPDFLLKEKYNSTSYTVVINNGVGVFNYGVVDASNLRILNGANEDIYNSALVYDFDNDGKTDVVLSGYTKNGSCSKLWYRSTGKGFELIHSTTVSSFDNAEIAARRSSFLIGDFNGDGSVDLLNYGPSVYAFPNDLGRGADLKWRLYSDVKTNKMGKIKRITNGSGQVADIEYTTMADRSTYTQQKDAVYPILDINNVPIKLVKTVTQSSSLIDKANQIKTEYNYSGLKIHPLKGILGFAKTEVKDNIDNKTISYYDINQNFFYPNLIKSQVFKSDTLVSESDFLYAVQTIDQIKKRYYPYFVKQDDKDQLNNNKVTKSFANYQYGKPKTIITYYHEFGLREELNSLYNEKGLPTTITTTKSNRESRVKDRVEILYDKNKIKEKTSYAEDNLKVSFEKYEYDLYGNTISHTQTPFDSNEALTDKYTYSDDGKYLLTEESFDNKKIEYNYDRLKGLTTWVHDHNSDQSVIYGYDAMGRVTKKTDQNKVVLSEVSTSFYPLKSESKWEYLSEFEQLDIYYSADYMSPQRQTFSRQDVLYLEEGQVVDYDCQNGPDKSLPKMGYDNRLIVSINGYVIKDVDPDFDSNQRFVIPRTGTYVFDFIVTMSHNCTDERDFVEALIDLKGYISTNKTTITSTSPYPGVLYSVTETGDDQPTLTTYYDGRGQAIKSLQTRFDGSLLTVDKVYDKGGKLLKESLPYKGDSSSAKWNVSQYDKYGRIEKVTSASGNVVSYAYAPNSTTETKDGIKITRKYNPIKQLIEVNDPGGTTTYKYRADGQPFKITTIGGIETSFTYDDYGRQTSIVDPNAGVLSYAYDEKGNAKSTTNANGKTILMEYDLWSRLTKKILDGITFNYSYDERGNLKSVLSDNGISREYKYLRDNSLQRKTEKVDEYVFTTAYSYTKTKDLSSVSYASKDGNIVTENYSYKNGYNTEVKLNTGEVVWNLLDENTFGLSTLAQTGNFTRSYGYDEYGYPIEREVKLNNNSISKFNYEFDRKTGNLNNRSDYHQRMAEFFKYDGLNRLTHAENNSVSNLHPGYSISYDDNGNIAEHSTVGVFEYSSNKPYAISALGLHDEYSTYKKSCEFIEYNSMNRPTLIQSNAYSSVFKYDDEGNRMRMDVSRLDGQTKSLYSQKVYFDDKYEIESSVDAYFTEWVFLDGDAYNAPAVYAKKDGRWDVYYIIRDYLGSINTILTKDGTILQDLRYNAWGRVCQPREYELYPINEEPKLLLGRGFTGHEHLTEYGIINMNARLYDPYIGRFLSVDPYVQMPDFSQSFNRYAYGLNNPLKYTDPSGELFWLIPVAIGVYLGASSVNGTFNPGKWDYGNWQTYAGMAVGGVAGYSGAVVGAGIFASAAAGGASTISAGVAGGMMGGMVSGAINGAGMTAIMGGNFNDIMGDMTKGAVMGSLGGALSGGIGATIGDFSGVSGGAFKNGIYELGHSALTGVATGLAGGAMMAAMEQDAAYLWQGAVMGATLSIGMAGLRIGLMGSAIIPPGIESRFAADDAAFGIKSSYPIYRRGGLLRYFTPGITLGRNMMVDTRYLNSKDSRSQQYYYETLAHERAHIYQQKIMGSFNFYKRILHEYFINPGYSNNPYGNPSCLDYWADQYMYLTP